MTESLRRAGDESPGTRTSRFLNVRLLGPDCIYASQVTTVFLNTFSHVKHLVQTLSTVSKILNFSNFSELWVFHGWGQVKAESRGWGMESHDGEKLEIYRMPGA